MTLRRLTNRSLHPWFKAVVHWRTRYAYLRCGRREWVWRW